jgi:CRISPR-associated protein Cas2
MRAQRFSHYRLMWIVVFFDLPTDEKEDRFVYTQFRKSLLKNGFAMFQFSVYIRHCASRENAEVHLKRIKRSLPDRGKTSILCITDKQFETMEIFHGFSKSPTPQGIKQLEMF